MASLTITWHAMQDAKTCPVCRALDGYTWVFEANKDVLDDRLIHPQYGVVWSLAEGSRAHGHMGFNCRCHITHEFQLEDLLMKLQKLREIVKAAAEKKGIATE